MHCVRQTTRDNHQCENEEKYRGPNIDRYPGVTFFIWSVEWNP